MAKQLLFALIFIFIISLYAASITYDIIPQGFWGFKEFCNPLYYTQLRKEWEARPSSFLLRKLYSVTPMRFGIAARILAMRKEARAVDVLINKVNSSYVDNQIHFSACNALAEISPSLARDILFKIVEGHKDGKGTNSPQVCRYKNALRVLASMKDERVYQICLQMAQSEDRGKREFALDGMLHYFDNHGKELLPLYLAYLNSKESYKGQVIKEIMSLKRPEAISALKEFASINNAYEKDVHEAVRYLEGLR